MDLDLNLHMDSDFDLDSVTWILSVRIRLLQIESPCPMKLYFVESLHWSIKLVVF